MRPFKLVALVLLGAATTAAAQSLDGLLRRGASELMRAAEQAVRDAATPAPPPASAPPPAPTPASSLPVPGAAPSPVSAPPPVSAPLPVSAPANATTALPPGWTPRAPHAMEQAFVAPQATTRVASEVRRLTSLGPSELWHGNVISERIELDNPYLAADDPFFGVMQRMACMADGSVIVFSEAKIQPDGYMKGTPYATGVWRIAPDGAIMAIGAARHTITRNKDPFCGVPVGRSGLDPLEVGPATTGADGSIVFPYGPPWAFGRKAVVLRLTPDARLEPVPNDIQTCALEPPEPTKKRFTDVGAAARDPQGNTYVWDAGGCTLNRVAPDGTTSVLVPRERVCPRGRPEDFFRADAMAWDPVHGELVASGDLLWLKSPDADNYSTIWRVRPDGALRRVFLGRKLGPSVQQVDGIGGLAVDARGAILFGAGVTRGNGYQIMKLDETKGRAEVVAGIPSPGRTEHGDGPARQAQFRKIWGLCFVPDGTLFVHDGTHVVRKITPAGHVTTWAF